MARSIPVDGRSSSWLATRRVMADAQQVQVVVVRVFPTAASSAVGAVVALLLENAVGAVARLRSAPQPHAVFGDREPA